MIDRLMGADRSMTPEVDVDGEDSLTGSSFWLDLEPEPIYGVLHAPRGGPHTRVAALILPPFGVDDEYSYRPRRDWATSLAEAGITAARIDFPGTEDSVGSPFASNRLGSWVDATVQAARWLRERTGCDRLVVVGISIGGLIGYQAISAGAPFDDLILWGVRASGRAHVREQRALAAMIAGEIVEPLENTRTADGDFWLGGHMMSTETADALSAVNLLDAPLPQAELRRVLLVGRDAHGVDEKLARGIADSGAELTVIEADDYRLLVAQPDWGWSPAETISASIEWLQAAPDAAQTPTHHEPTLETPKVRDSVTFDFEGVSIRERLFEVKTSEGRLTGVISEPAAAGHAPFCLVLMSAGALRRTGPSRIYVEMARRAAADGIPAARFDFPGVGDSDGGRVKAYERRPADDPGPLTALSEVYDHLHALGLADRFVGAGLCLGGYFAIRTILEDERSIGAVSINSPALLWTNAHAKRGVRWFASVSGTQELEVAERVTDRRRTGLLRGIAHHAGHLRRAIEFRLGNKAMHLELLWRFEHRANISGASKTLDELNQNGARVLFLFSGNETVPRILALSRLAAKIDRSSNVELELLQTGDHNLRPLRIQELVLERVSSVLRDVGASVNRTTPESAADVEQVVHATDRLS
jgi:pimeloyl-ACP methyl ester carboxylesterase